MAFNKETKKKKEGQVCLNFKTAGNKSVLRALSKEMDLEYKSTNYNIFMHCSVHVVPLITDKNALGHLI
jgi:hypothetical protein